MKRINFTFLLLGVFMLLSSITYSQALFPNNLVADGDINASVYDPSTQKTYLGGNFTAFGDPRYANLALINPTSGSLVTSSLPAINGSVNKIVQDGSSFYVVGNFYRVNGLLRMGIIKLNSNRQLDLTFNPSITIDTTGDTYSGIYDIDILGNLIAISGQFSVNGAPRVVAVINKNTGAINSWNPSFSFNFNLFDNKIYDVEFNNNLLFIGGDFKLTSSTSSNSIIRRSFAAFSVSTTTPNAITLSNGFNFGLIDTTQQTPVVRALCKVGNTLYVGGFFTGGTNFNRSGIFACDMGTGTLISSFNARLRSSGGVNTIVSIPNNQIFIGGYFNTTVINGNQRYGFALLTPTGAFNTAASLNLSGSGMASISKISVVSSSANKFTLFISGIIFSQYNTYRNDNRRLNGMMIYDFDATNNSFVLNTNILNKTTQPINSCIRDAAGLYLIGGDFAFAGGIRCPHLAVLNSAGGLDMSATNSFFRNSYGNMSIKAMALIGSNLYLGGTFKSNGSTSTLMGRNDLIKISKITLSTDNTFPQLDASLDNKINVLIADGNNLYIGGDFKKYQNSNGISINKTNFLAWNTATNSVINYAGSLNGEVRTIAFNSTNIFLGGDFSTPLAGSSNGIAKFSKSGLNLLSFPSLNGHSSVSGLRVFNSDLYVVDENGIFVYGAATNNYRAKYNFQSIQSDESNTLMQVTSTLFMVNRGGKLFFNQLHNSSTFRTYPMFEDIRLTSDIKPLFNITGNSGFVLVAESFNKINGAFFSLTRNSSRLFKLNNNISLPPPPPVPTVSASSIILTPFMDNVSVSWTPGNGMKRVVLVRKNFNPVIPTNYSTAMDAQGYFSTGTNLGGGTFCVYDGSDSECWVSGLEFNSNYKFAVVEYNTDGTLYSYKTTNVPIGSCNTEQLLHPNPASSLSVSNITSNSFDLEWIDGDGMDRMLIIKQGLNSITFNPVTFQNYYPSQILSDGSKYEEVNNITYLPSGKKSYTFTNLNPSTSYSVSVIESNYTPYGPLYPLTANPKINVTTSALAPLPLTQASNINVTPSTTSATISWTRGSGDRSLVLVSKLPNAPIIGNNPIAAVNGQMYFDWSDLSAITPQAMISYFNGTQQNAQVVYHGSGNSVLVTGLNPGSVYQVAVIESNGGLIPLNYSQIVYLTAPRPTATFTTNALIIAPSLVSNSHNVLVSQDDALLNWSGGNASNSLVVLKKDGPVNFNPVNDNFYSPNSSFGLGTQLGVGNYAVYSGSSQSFVNIANLEPDAEYHFAVFDYNSQGQIAKYNTAPYRGIFRTSRAWPVRAGGPKKDAGGGVVTDASGNVYVAGTFETFSSWGTTSLPASGGNDIFLTKYSATGKPQWVVKQGGTDADAASAVAIDNSGNLIMTGSFRGSGTFGIGNTLVSNGTDDIFLSKVSQSGSVIWSKRAGGTDQDVAFAITTDNVGDIYIAGYFRGTITFPGSTVSFTSKGGTDALIAKYDGGGNLIWAKSGGGTGNDFAYGVAVKGSNVAMVGQFDLSADFSSTILNSAGSADIFIAEYNAANGNLNWVNRFGGTGADIGFSITSAGSDYVLTGQFSNSILVGSTTLTSSGNSDVLVCRVNSLGTSVWAKKAGGISQDAGRGIALNSAGDKLFVTGSFAETANFGTTSLSSFGNLDIFVATVDYATGDFETVYQNGGPLDDEARGITAATANTSFITGYFNGQGSFGNVDLTSAGDWDIFVHKFTLVVAPDLANGLVAWYKMNGNAQDASGNGNHGTAQNINPTSDRSNTANKAYLFQKNNITADVLKVDPVNVGGPSTTNNSTYLAWLKTAPDFANSNTPKPIFSTSFDDTEVRSIQLSDIGTLTYSFYGSSTLQVDQSSVVPIQDNSWHHIAVVYKAGVEVIFYLDGLEFGRSYITNFSTPENLLGTHWNIGHLTNSDRLTPIYSFNGSLDDVRIYRRALTSNEINVIKNQSAVNSLLEESDVKVAKLSPDVKMWPNPSTGKLNVDLGSRVSNAKVQVLDLSGTSVLTKEFNGLNDAYLNLDVQNLSMGIYFVQIDMDGSVSTQKLIISK